MSSRSNGCWMRRQLLRVSRTTWASSGRSVRPGRPKVAGLRAPDPRTLEIELEHPSFVFRYAMAMNFSAVVPRERVERFGSDLTSTWPVRAVTSSPAGIAGRECAWKGIPTIPDPAPGWMPWTS